MPTTGTDRQPWVRQHHQGHWQVSGPGVPARWSVDANRHRTADRRLLQGQGKDKRMVPLGEQPKEDEDWGRRTSTTLDDTGGVEVEMLIEQTL